MWCAGATSAFPIHPCAHISKSYNLVILCAMHVVELSYVSRNLFLTDLLSATFTLYYLCTHFTHTHTIFLCMGISDSDAVLMNAEKKRQKSLQCNSKISTKRFSALMGAVSAVGDSKRSSAVDDLNCHTQPSQVLALTSAVKCGCMLHMVSSLYCFQFG